MSRYRSKPYRYSRWPLIKQTTGCILGLIPGIIFLILPLGPGRLIGLFPIAVSIFQWQFKLHPQWKYVIKPEMDGISIGSRFYPWNELIQLQIKRNGNQRQLYLGSHLNAQEILIKDDLPRFDELVQECFLYMNQQSEKAPKRI